MKYAPGPLWHMYSVVSLNHQIHKNYLTYHICPPQFQFHNFTIISIPAKHLQISPTYKYPKQIMLRIQHTILSSKQFVDLWPSMIPMDMTDLDLSHYWGNGLLPDSIKPSTQAITIYHQFDSQDTTANIFIWNVPYVNQKSVFDNYRYIYKIPVTVFFIFFSPR